MSSRCTAVTLRAAWLAGATLVIGCGVPRHVEIEVSLAPDVAARVRTVEVVIRQDRCGTGAEVYRETVRRDAMVMRLPDPLGATGPYCFEALGRDVGCVVVASAAMPVDAPPSRVELVLELDEGGSVCESVACVDGLCEDTCAPEGASCTQGGEPGICRSAACCTGCWDGERCASGLPARELVGGQSFRCMRTDGGDVACWGSNGQGELGDGLRGGTTGPVWRAEGVRLSFGDDPEPIERLAAGPASGYALARDGDLYGWGWNDQGQLGVGDVSVHLAPTRVPHPDGVGWLSVVALAQSSPGLMQRHACALDRLGELYCWGANGLAQVDPSAPAGAGDALIPSPRRVAGTFGAVALTHGATCALSLTGNRVTCWGDNSRGALGTGDTTQPTGMIRVTLPSDVGDVAEIVGASVGFCVRTELDRVLCWGDATTEALPTPPAAPVRAVTELTDLPAAPSARLERTLWLANHHGVLLRDASVVVWGRDVAGELGLGEAVRGTTVSPPVLAPPIPGASTSVLEASLGTDSTCLRLADGSLACTGSNLLGGFGVSLPADAVDTSGWHRFCPCEGCAER